MLIGYVTGYAVDKAAFDHLTSLYLIQELPMRSPYGKD